MKIKLTLTDTLNGELNYGWSRCKEIEASDDSRDSEMIELAKAAFDAESDEFEILSFSGEIVLLGKNKCVAIVVTLT